MAGQQAGGHLHLTLVFLVPLAALVVARRISGEITQRTMVLVLAALLIAQFLISLEVFATMAVAGAFGLLLIWSFAGSEISRQVQRLIPELLFAYALALVVLSPCIYALFGFGFERGAMWSADAYSADLFNFLVPVPTTALGTIPFIDHFTMRFRTGSIYEVNAYVGLPLMIIVAAYARSRWREPMGKTLIELLIIFSILSLGPRLRIGNVPSIGLPYKALLNLPLLNRALPARFMMYAFLVLAVISSLWFGSSPMGLRGKIVIAALIIVSTIPSPSCRWLSSAQLPAFFTNHTYSDLLRPIDNVLILPFGIRGNSMLWHAETGMYFHMVGGWTGPQPLEFAGWPIVDALTAVRYIPDSLEQMAAFIAHYEVSAVVISRDDPDLLSWDGIIRPISSKVYQVGGVNLYRISAQAVEPYKSLTQIEMRKRSTTVAINSLVIAADEWRLSSNNPTGLTPLRAIQRGLIEGSWFVGPHTIPAFISGGSEQELDRTQHFFAGAWLWGSDTGEFGTGLYGSYGDLRTVIDRFRGTASHIYFPYPNDLTSSTASIPSEKSQDLLSLVFSGQQLSAAASALRNGTKPARFDGNGRARQ